MQHADPVGSAWLFEVSGQRLAGDAEIHHDPGGA